MKEIDKLGLVIKTILERIGIMKHSGGGESSYGIAKIDLLNQLDIDLDVLLAEDNFMDLLIHKYGFSNCNLEKFAELLYDFMLSESDGYVKAKYVSHIFSIYRYLETARFELSFNTYLIIQELGKYK